MSNPLKKALIGWEFWCLFPFFCKSLLRCGDEWREAEASLPVCYFLVQLSSKNPDQKKSSLLDALSLSTKASRVLSMSFGILDGIAVKIR